MSEGAVVLWFILTVISVAFVAVDIRSTPAHPVIKWSFVILSLLTGPFAAFFYVLGCREPLRGTHQAYVAARWRQVLGSTMHCAAGDGLGIIAGAIIALGWRFPPGAEFALEYLLGFGFGWAIFQSFAMRDMAGGSYLSALKQTFLPELLSMNLLMAGMIVSMRYLMPRIVGGSDPLAGGFWFVMSMALIAGFALAFPINWWLVANGLKHDMVTVRLPNAVAEVPGAASASASAGAYGPGHREHGEAHQVSIAAEATAVVLTLACLAMAVALANRIGG